MAGHITMDKTCHREEEVKSLKNGSPPLKLHVAQRIMHTTSGQPKYSTVWLQCAGIGEDGHVASFPSLGIPQSKWRSNVSEDDQVSACMATINLGSLGHQLLVSLSPLLLYVNGISVSSGADMPQLILSCYSATAGVSYSTSRGMG
ncbi:hypothetical protein EWB00_000352 [Schistosoma japonicum]|uniref:Uncharacterized protein n=1 Tax=Schistosoma japonicum TaxID=6182 RepID=A0A4Z2CKF1_SCHJA|nr:hypothetical protein EWB00_000352 [Schistosoma japonicum]